MLLKRHFLMFAGLLAMLCPSAMAENWAGVDFVFGSLGYKGARTSFSSNVSTRTLAGIEARYFKVDTLPDVVYVVKAPVTINSDIALTTIRPFVSPSTKLVNTSAAGLSVDNMFLLNRSDKDESETLLIANVSAAAQNTRFDYADGTSNTALLPQITYELGMAQHYFREFYFTYTCTANQYLTSVYNVGLPELSLDQGDLASTGMSAALTALPLWTAGVDIMRRSGDDKDSNVLFGYRYLTYRDARPATHALTLGARMKVNKDSNFEFSYNWLVAGSDSKRNFYRIFLNMGF